MTDEHRAEAAGAGGGPPPDAVELATVFAVLSLPPRLQIVLRLARGECSVGTLVAVVKIPQAKVSHHLRILRAAGLVECRRESRRVFYRFSHPFANDGITIDAGTSRVHFTLKSASAPAQLNQG